MGGPGGARTMTEEEMRDMFGDAKIRSRTSSARSSVAAAGAGEGRGRRTRAPRSQKGRDIESEAELTLEEAYHGAMRRISITLAATRAASTSGFRQA